jgi:choline dehydrogenase
MGADDLAVVDAILAVRDIHGLRIADGSILPNITTGNAQAHYAIINEWAAKMVRNKCG